MSILLYADQCLALEHYWTLEELGLEYEVRPVERWCEDRGTEMFEQLEAERAQPLLVDEPVVIGASSAAILIHLGDRYGAGELAPRPLDPDRGRYLSWILRSGAVMTVETYADAQAEVPERTQAYGGGRVQLARVLATRPFILGDRFTLADIVIGESIGFLVDELGDPATDPFGPYLERVRARRAYRRAAAAHDARHPYRDEFPRYGVD